ncbi:pentapeptide repeat-containing protein [Haloactinopolyspora alba]|uniref:pentapeptide repeat-containing protein n=1 Tax=Haloactinopolyspora alba TaxID=648780 RepID=UPI00197AC92C
MRADCANCAGLCCVALPFTASADFAIDKPAGEPCTHLRADFRCGIHTRLRADGFPGCAVFDCFGAGQQVTRTTFGGHDWRQDAGTARRMFGVFGVMRQLHELLWYLADAQSRPQTLPIRPDLHQARQELERLTESHTDVLLETDVADRRGEVDVLLQRASELVRADATAAAPGAGRELRRADLVGARLNGADLRGADLRGALLIAADLSGADLRSADVIGADFRDAVLAGADLTDSIFLTQAQVNAARGDAATALPAAVARPDHW